MTELKHWLDESSDADDFERAVLRSGLDADPPPGIEDEVWSRVVGVVGLAPLSAVPAAMKPAAAAVKAGAAVKGSAVWLGVGKGLLIGLAVYGAASGGGSVAERLLGHTTPVAPVTASSLSSSIAPKAAALAPSLDVPAPAVVEEALSPGPSAKPGRKLEAPKGGAAPLEAKGSPVPSVVAFEDAAPAVQAREEHASQLAAEASALRQARDALRTGQLAAAFAVLESSQKRFTVPELYQEREALMIELLNRSGQPQAAALRAKAFLSRFPESPHAGQIRQFVAPP